MIRAAIFDVGGVLTTSPVEAIRRFEVESGLPRAALRPALASEDGAWSRFEKSEITADEFVIAFEEEAAELGYEVDAAGLLAAFLHGLTIHDEMVAASQELRKHVKVGCITNNVTREEEPRSPPLVLEDLFDVVIESSKVGLRKPDPAIYLLACERLGVAPEETVFLDDFGVNLKAARELGMTTIKVEDPATALEELERAVGVPLRRPGGVGGRP